MTHPAMNSTMASAERRARGPSDFAADRPIRTIFPVITLVNAPPSATNPTASVAPLATARSTSSDCRHRAGGVGVEVTGSEHSRKPALHRWGGCGAARTVFPKRLRGRWVVPGFDGLGGLCEFLCEEALADGAGREPDYPSLDVLAFPHDNDVHVGLPVGLPREGVRVPGGTAPRVGVDGFHDHAVGVRPVVSQTFPDTAGALGDIGVSGALVVDFEVVVGAVAKELRAAWPEVGESGDEL